MAGTAVVSDGVVVSGGDSGSTSSGGAGGAILYRIPVKQTNPTQETGNSLQPENQMESRVTNCDRNETTSFPFIDTINHWSQIYIDNLYKHCIVDGEAPTIFAPQHLISRAELLKIAVNINNIAEQSFTNIFTDVKESDWFSPYVISGVKAGIISGYENNLFKPDQNLTRSEALKILLLAKGVSFGDEKSNFADVEESNPYYKYIAYAQQNNIVQGYTELQNRSGSVKDFYSFPRFLVEGSNGFDVVNLKSVLTDLGYYNGIIDNVFDKKLTESVKMYQVAKEIVSTGNFGKLSRLQLLSEHIDEHERIVFRPYNLITRAEATKILYLVDKLPKP